MPSCRTLRCVCIPCIYCVGMWYYIVLFSYVWLFTPSFRLSRYCLHARACALPQPPKEGECYLQKQTNMSDCGVFAIAFAMAIYNRQWPELLWFDGLMRHFPASHRKRCHETTRTEMVKVFCKCRRQEKGKMICCDRCLEWYHSTCEVNVPAIAQCNCTSLMITVTTSFSVMIIKTITDSDYNYTAATQCNCLLCHD